MSRSDEVKCSIHRTEPSWAGADRTEVVGAVDDDPGPLRAKSRAHAVSHSLFIVPSEALKVGTQHLSAEFDKPIDVLSNAGTEGDCHRDSLRAIKSAEIEVLKSQATKMRGNVTLLQWRTTVSLPRFAR